MPRYFMGDTRLAGWERMTRDTSRKPPTDTPPCQKGPRKKLPCSQAAKPRPRERKIKKSSG